jgi:hypothetical protein
MTTNRYPQIRILAGRVSGTVLSGTLAIFAAVGCQNPDRVDTAAALDLRKLSEPCAECRLSLEEVVAYHDPAAPASPATDAVFHPCGVASIDESSWVLGRLVGGGWLALFDSGGASAGSLGRGGEGPGEFGRDLRVLRRPGGGLAVIDRSQSRVTVYGPDLSLLSVERIPVRPDAQLLLDDWRLVLHARPGPATEVGDDRFVMVDLATGESRGLPSSVATDIPREERDLDQWIAAPLPEGGFIAAQIWNYDVHMFADDGTLLESLSRRPDWMPSRTIDSGLLEGIHVDRPPPSVLSHLHVDSDGLVWVYALVPDSDWRPLSRNGLGAAWAHETFDTRVEVFEPESASVIASGKFDEVLAPVCGSNDTFTVRDTETGDVEVVVSRLSTVTQHDEADQ